MRTRSGSKVQSRFSPYLVAPSGLNSCGEFPRVNPGLCFIGHFGPQIGNVQITGHFGPYSPYSFSPNAEYFATLSGLIRTQSMVCFSSWPALPFLMY
jgi:hypothetical protein